MTQQQLDFERVAAAIRFLREHRHQQPDLHSVAAHVHLSPQHFQRTFTRFAGVSPKQFLKYLNLQVAKERMADANNLAEVADDIGLSGSGRLHDLFVSMEGMTPAQYRNGGATLTIRTGFFDSPFGRYLLGVSERDRICALMFADDPDAAVAGLHQDWKQARIMDDERGIQSIADVLFDRDGQVDMLVHGTPLQIKVWEALLKIPMGDVISYSELAARVGKPTAVRAVANAVARNSIAWLIPCHRVIRKAGHITQYRWGAERKLAMIGRERALVELNSP